MAIQAINDGLRCRQPILRERRSHSLMKSNIAKLYSTRLIGKQDLRLAKVNVQLTLFTQDIICSEREKVTYVNKTRFLYAC